MKTITKLPDLANSAKKLKVMCDLPKVCDHNTFFGMSMLNAIWSNTPANEIIKTIQEQAKSNRKQVISAIGEDFLTLIQSIQL